MATTSGSHLDRRSLERAGPLVAGIATCTALLTAAFVGVVGLASGSSGGVVARLPLYVLASSVAFVGTLLVVDHVRTDGLTVLGRAVAAGVVTFVLVALGAEGVVYALTSPESVVASHLFAYLFSAAIIASGLGYWGLHNWREVRGLVADGRL